MSGFIAKRILAGILTLFCIATLCFFITRFAPGNPFSGERQLPEHIMENLRARYHMDDPVPLQYVRTMTGYLTGNFGVSITHGERPVRDLIFAALGPSCLLGALAFLLALLAGIPLGVIAACRRNQLPDHAAMSFSVLGICIPNFLLGPLLILVFSFLLGWLPAARWPQEFSLYECSRLILPVLTLSFAHIAYISRLTRSGMLEVLGQDYIRTARAKGLDEKSVVLGHALRNGITPVLSYAGPMAAMIITGSVVVETIFDLPGLGRYFVNSALARDYAPLMGAVLVFSTLIILFNLAVDLAYAWLDPRVRTS